MPSDPLQDPTSDVPEHMSVGDAIKRALVTALMVGLSAFMLLGSLLWSNYPQYVLLAAFGEEAQASIVGTREVQYASFPYSGFINDIEFTSAENEVQRFEVTGEYLESDLKEVFQVKYLPWMPSLVQIQGHERLSVFLLLCSLSMAALVLLMLGLLPEEHAHRIWVLRPFFAAGRFLFRQVERAVSSISSRRDLN